MKTPLNRILVLIPLFAVLILTGLWITTLPEELVVYCAHDAVYAEEILRDFTRHTGIHVQTRFDTEATKSLGLINLILQERANPRCDLFWNNELLGMIELREQGVLEPYRGAGWKRMPERFRDAEGHWVGFAARLRVYIFNHEATASNEGFVNLLNNNPERVAIAKPLFGTTLTQYTVMWEMWGPNRLKTWHAELRKRGLREVNGNSAVKDVVATGACVVGPTDTDDYFVAVDDRQPVRMQPVRISALKPGTPRKDGDLEPDDGIKERPNGFNDHGVTICIPNTVGIIKGTRNRSSAERLVDYLTSREVELALARAKSRQIPLGPVDEDDIPDDVKSLTAWSKDSIDLRPLLPARRECLKWLQSEYLK